MDKSRVPFFLFSCAVVILLLSSCSIIGLVIGAKTKTDSEKRIILPAEKIVQLERGTTVAVKTKKHDSIYGEFHGRKMKKNEAYLQEYNLFYMVTQGVCPKLGDTLLVYDKAGIIQKEVFLGYDFDRMYFSTGDESSIYPLEYDRIEFIRDRQGYYLSKKSLQAHLQSCRLPIYSEILLDTPEGDRLVDYYDIESVSYKEENSVAPLIGFAVGLAVDILIVTAVLKQNENFKKAF